MTATNKTTVYELPVFIPTDKPTWLGDFNGAMNSIEAGIVDAKNSGTTVIQTANTALNIANQAETHAQSATTAANNAVALANTANTNATEAKTSANNAVSLANTANTNATEAKTSAIGATTTANNAISVANAASAQLAARLDPVNVTLTSTNAAVTASRLTVKNRRAILYVEYDGDPIGTVAAWENKVLGNVPAGYHPTVRQTSIVPFHPNWVGGVDPEGEVTLMAGVSGTHTGGSYMLSFTWDLD